MLTVWWPVLCFLPPDYPYCLIGKELKGVIKGLLGRCTDILPDFFDHCVSTMLRELDRQSGERGAAQTTNLPIVLYVTWAHLRLGHFLDFPGGLFVPLCISTLRDQREKRFSKGSNGLEPSLAFITWSLQICISPHGVYGQSK